MDVDNKVHILRLRAIVACGQSDGYLKEWDYNELGEIEAAKGYLIPVVELPYSKTKTYVKPIFSLIKQNEILYWAIPLK